jgi:DNA repair protein RadC
MISLEDCVGLCGLTEQEVLAIAEHEHVPEMAATALAQYLLKQEHGIDQIRDMIVHDIRQAQ